MDVKLYVANLAKYNEGILGEDEEYAIHDYEAPFRLGEYSDVYATNEIAAVLSRYDSRVVVTLSECMDDVDDVVRLLESGDYSLYFDVDNLLDVAADMVDGGYFGPIPPSLSCYIDYEKIARDLKMDGWYMHYDLKVAVRPHP
ncbi:antirestriction protein ArdA [Brevibacillus sp. NRS-1366]|uniref:antirestriction protein ArdA n=1 Tax=Brevibacillus sp. NRS-1366 TaxID=3233899 RepID=UPI003D1CBCC8